MSHVIGVINGEVGRQNRAAVLRGERLLAVHLEANGWLDCSKGAQMFYVHPDLRSPIDGDQCFVFFQDAVEIQSRWELGWPDVQVKAAPNYEPSALAPHDQDTGTVA